MPSARSSSGFTEQQGGPGPPLLGALLRRPWERVRDRILERLQASGFDDLDTPYLQVLQYPGPHGLRPSELAARLRVSKQALNHLLGGLESRGYLERRADPDDLRSRRIVLTSRGRRAMQVMRDEVRAVERDWRELLGEQDFGRLEGLLRRLADDGQ